MVSEEPECRVDRDCPSQLTCMRETCLNPCVVSNPCSPSQQCIVTDIQTSVRSVACICPEGTLAGHSGTCETGNDLILLPVCSNAWIIFFSVDARPQCVRDQDCSNKETCHQGSCILACSRIGCGPNANCMSEFHKGICRCLPGYFGNPDSGCEKGTFTLDKGLWNAWNSFSFSFSLHFTSTYLVWMLIKQWLSRLHCMWI